MFFPTHTHTYPISIIFYFSIILENTVCLRVCFYCLCYCLIAKIAIFIFSNEKKFIFFWNKSIGGYYTPDNNKQQQQTFHSWQKKKHSNFAVYKPKNFYHSYFHLWSTNNNNYHYRNQSIIHSFICLFDIIVILCSLCLGLVSIHLSMCSTIVSISYLPTHTVSHMDHIQIWMPGRKKEKKRIIDFFSRFVSLSFSIYFFLIRFFQSKFYFIVYTHTQQPLLIYPTFFQFLLCSIFLDHQVFVCLLSLLFSI